MNQYEGTPTKYWIRFEYPERQFEKWVTQTKGMFITVVDLESWWEDYKDEEDELIAITKL